MPHRHTQDASSPLPHTLDPKLVSTGRAIADLRRGLAVALVDETGGLNLVIAAEEITDAGIEALASLGASTPAVALTRRRAQVLGLAPDGEETVCNITSLAGEPLDAARIAALGDPLEPLDSEILENIQVKAVPLRNCATAAVSLMKLARLLPACYLVALDGDQKPADPVDWARRQNMILVRASDVLRFEEAATLTLRPVSDARVPLDQSEDTRIFAFRPEDGSIEHLAIVIGEPDPQQPVLIRIHSECFTGDLLGSLRCDCGDQLKGAIKQISDTGSGILLYLAQEGRGIGLVNKLRAYTLQDRGIDTYDANEMLGYEADERVFLPAFQILHHFGVHSVRLMTNNPRKVKALQDSGVNVVERVAHAFRSNQHNEWYLAAKADKGGHMI